MSKDNYDEDLRRVMTVCGGDWSGRWHDDGNTDSLSLLFGDRERDLTQKEQIALMFHPDVAEFFGRNTYYGAIVQYESDRHRWSRRLKTEEDVPGMFCITPTAKGLYILGKDEEHPFFIRRNVFLFETSLQVLHDACQFIHKWTADANGCQCSRKGDRCILSWHSLTPVKTQFDTCQRHFSFMEVPTLHQPTQEWVDENMWEVDGDRWEEWKCAKRVQFWKSTFAGFRIIPPTATSTEPLRPVTPAIRPAQHCNFTRLEWVREEFSARSRAGVETRRTINQQCRHCFFGGERRGYGDSTKKFATPCNYWFPKRCKHGAWTEEAVVDYTLQGLERTLKARSKFTLQEIWAVAQLAGTPFKVKAGQTGRPREWQICRLTDAHRYQECAARIQVSRTARSARDLSLHFNTLKELREFLPADLQEQLTEALKKPIDREALALWAHLTTLAHGKTRTGYFNTDHACGFTSWQHQIGAVFLVENSGVRVQYCLSREERYHDFRDFTCLRDWNEDLILFSLTDKEDPEFRPSLAHWVR